MDLSKKPKPHQSQKPLRTQQKLYIIHFPSTTIYTFNRYIIKKIGFQPSISIYTYKSSRSAEFIINTRMSIMIIIEQFFDEQQNLYDPHTHILISLESDSVIQC